MTAWPSSSSCNTVPGKNVKAGSDAGSVAKDGPVFERSKAVMVMVVSRGCFCIQKRGPLCESVFVDGAGIGRDVAGAHELDAVGVAGDCAFASEGDVVAVECDGAVFVHYHGGITHV